MTIIFGREEVLFAKTENRIKKICIHCLISLRVRKGGERNANGMLLLIAFSIKRLDVCLKILPLEKHRSGELKRGPRCHKRLPPSWSVLEGIIINFNGIKKVCLRMLRNNVSHPLRAEEIFAKLFHLFKYTFN